MKHHRKKFIPHKLILFSIFLVLFWFLFIPPIGTWHYYIKYYRPFNKQAKILLVHGDGYGEKEAIARIAIASQNSNIKFLSVDAKLNEPEKVFLKRRKHISNIITSYKPNLVFSFEDILADKYPGQPNYTTLNRGANSRYIYRDTDGRYQFKQEYAHLAKFDVITTAFEDTNLLSLAIKHAAKEFFDVRWHMTVHDENYQPANPDKIFYSGGVLWDTTRNSAKYKQIFKQLDNNNILRVCGPAAIWGDLANSTVGELPFDGRTTIAKMHTAGIALLLHDAEHLEGPPSSRIFEAAAANVVIISDKHPFIQKYFADNVLYIDIEKNADDIYKQIEKHRQWIIANPTKAKVLAQNCNKIYKEKFLLEAQLKNLLSFNEEYKEYTKFISDIKPISKLGSKANRTIKNYLNNYSLPDFWAIIQVHNNNFTYYYDKELPPGNSTPWLNKLYSLARQLNKIKASNEQIPDGTYVVSLLDGLHTAYDIPVLAFSTTKQLQAQQKIVLLPDNQALKGYRELFNSIDEAKDKYPWSNKLSKIFWRGQTTGHDFATDGFSSFPRLDFMYRAKDRKYIDAGFTHFTGDINLETRAKILHDFTLQDFVPPQNSLQYKYLFDIDGHSCSYSRMAWILYSNSLLLKHNSDNVQWYYHKLKPNTHYLPIANDFSNLPQQFIWAQTHPKEVQNIIRNAQNLATEVFSDEAIAKATKEAFIKYNLLTNN